MEEKHPFSSTAFATRRAAVVLCDESRPCLMCGKPTPWYEVNWYAPLCSSRCEEELQAEAIEYPLGKDYVDEVYYVVGEFEGDNIVAVRLLVGQGGQEPWFGQEGKLLLQTKVYEEAEVALQKYQAAAVQNMNKMFQMRTWPYARVL